MSNAVAAHDHPAPARRTIADSQAQLQLNDYRDRAVRDPARAGMFTAMVGGPLIVARLLELPAATRITMVTGTMIGCGLATMVSALGVSFIGPRLPIVMGVFYIFIGPMVAISKEAGLGAAMTALMIGGLVQFAWSPLIGKLTGSSRRS
jgi:xanthine/uracil permease